VETREAGAAGDRDGPNPLADPSGLDRRAPPTVALDNVEPRLDVHGEIVDAHDGCLQKFGASFYLYGTRYGNTTGFTQANRYVVYRSADLLSWEPLGDLLGASPPGTYFRPYVVFNPTTRMYVLWFNWYPVLGDGQIGVAVSDRPVGPFEIVSENVALSRRQPGDASLFVDDDGTGYVVYASIAEHHAVSIERLTPDLLGSTKVNGGILASDSEAPAMFRRGSKYYVLLDRTCPFCSGGSGARTFVASSPLGPYAELENINRVSGHPVVAAQQTFVARLPTRDGHTFVWMGDRWQSAPDGVKGHDFQHWEPLSFDDVGAIERLQNIERFSLDLR
jgi:hypothetical protein